MAAQTPRIFISYRREDTGAYAGWLYDRLVQQFGTKHVFKDADSLHPGVDFPRVIGQAIAACDVLVALVGTRWAGPTSGGLRIHDPDDWVRLELESGLDQGVRVVPLLADGATLPPESALPPSLHRLVHKQALPVRHESFGQDVRRLIALISSPLPGSFDDEEARRTTRTRAARFAAVEHLYRQKVDLDQPMYKYDPFMKVTYRRPELDLIVDALDFDEDVATLALVCFDVRASFKGLVKDSDGRRGLLAATPRRLIYAVRVRGGRVQFLPYSQVLSVDTGIVRPVVTLTLGDRNLVIEAFKPWQRAKEFAAYIQDRVTHRS